MNELFIACFQIEGSRGRKKMVMERERRTTHNFTQVSSMYSSDEVLKK